MKQDLLILIFAVLGLTACNNSGQQHNTENKISGGDTLAKAITANELLDKDTIIYDDFSFPIDSALSTKVLTEGMFHADEVWDNVAKEKWLGLFWSKAGCYLAETKLKTKRVYDAIIDEEETKKTGWDVQTVNKDSAIILIEALSYLTPHKVQEVILNKAQIFPGDTLRINYKGINYEIFATGGKKRGQGDSELFDVWNYKLYLTATFNGAQHKSLLVAQPNFDDQMINLIFAGDIDGDGILDLIIDTSRHYNVTSPTIYLSRPADSGEIVKPMGAHISMGC